MKHTMIGRLLHLIPAIAIVLGCPASLAAAQPASSAQIAESPVPPALEVPPGHSEFLRAQAVGTQNYVCVRDGAGLAWRFVGPQATLFVTFRNGTHQQVATHFLGANPSENGTPRPAWQHSSDTSLVWGRVVASSNDPNYVEPGAIPWLLVEAAGAAPGPAGGSFLTPTTFIQRLNTSGGVAPSTGCRKPADVGAMALVPYATDYAFYRDR